MCGKDLDEIFHAGTYPDPGTCYPLSNKPITSEECGRTSVQRIPYHGALFYRPFREYDQTPSEYAAVIELPIWQNVLGSLPNDLVV